MKSKRLILLFVVLAVLAIGGVVFLALKNSKQNESGRNQPTSLDVPAVSSSSSTIDNQVDSMEIMKTYRNTEWGFEFQYPVDWTMYANMTGYSTFSKFDLIGAPSDKEYLVYVPTPPFLMNIVVPEFAERQFSDLKDMATTTTVGGVIGLRYEYEEQAEYGKVRNITVILPVGQYKMILATVKNKEYVDIFNQILASFKFLNH